MNRKFLFALLLISTSAFADKRNSPADNFHFNMVGNGIDVDAPSVSASYQLHMPSAQGAANSCLRNDGSGNLSWLVGTSSNTASTLVERDSSGNFSAGTITASLTGNASTATSATNVTGTVAVANGGTGVTSFTQGSVVYAGSSTLTQDNANLFWDGSNQRLGIGTSSPISKLDIRENRSFDGTSGVNYENSSSTGTADIAVLNGSGALAHMDITGSSFAGGASVALFSSSGNATFLDLLSGSDVATGGSTPIVLIAGGYTNYPSITILSNGSPSKGGNVGINTITPSDSLQVAQGNIAIDNTTATTGQIVQGGSRAFHNYDGGIGANNANNLFVCGGGTNNACGNFTFVADATNGAGTGDTAVGSNALLAIVGGSGTGNSSNDTAVGASALPALTTGFSDTAVGTIAGFSLTTGINNAFFGAQAGFALTDGSRNTAIGAFSLTGDNLTAHGTGYAENTAFGNAAMGDTTGVASPNSAPTQNVAIGRSALRNGTSPMNNAAVGYESLFNGNAITLTAAIGWESGLGNSGFTRGTGNTFLGASADLSGDYQFSTAVGYNAKIGADHVMVLGDSSNTSLTVGIGTNTPTAKLQVHDGHYKSSQTTAPVPTVNANAGTGASCTLILATDVAGHIRLVTGTGPSSGDQCDVAFNIAYGHAPICTMTPQNATSGANAPGFWITTGTGLFSLEFANTPAAGTTYDYFYNCMETQ